MGKVHLKVLEVGIADVFGDMARLHFSHREPIKAGQILKLSRGDKTVPLVARGAPGNLRGHIWLDQATRETLRVEKNLSYDFTIDEASFLDGIKWAWSATNPAYRIASKLAVWSVMLGVLGLLLGLLSFWLALQPHQ